jgi:DNA-binding transcriptional LysR family regulator
MLRISVPVILSQTPFLNFLSGFLKAHARIRIDLFITNLFLDLIAENLDVAIRFGALEDSSVAEASLRVELIHWKICARAARPG